VRTFGRAEALHPVPLSRKVVQALASASIALCSFEKNVIDKLAEPARNGARGIARHRVQGRALVESRLARQGRPMPVTDFWAWHPKVKHFPQALRPPCRFVSMREGPAGKEKKPHPDS